MDQTKDMRTFIYAGSIIHSLSIQNLKFINDGVIVVRGSKVVELEESLKNLNVIQEKYQVRDENVYRLNKNQFLIPGLIDTHIHAPQYPNAGLGYDLPLLDWLQKYTFPLEARYSDKSFAQKVYKAVVQKTISHGTTASCYFATVHADTSIMLAKCAAATGQRAFVGKVNMNKNTPKNYGETLEESLGSTKRFIEDVLALNNELVKPIITPRFALSCDMQLMKGLGQLAKEYNIPIQTHISENKVEVNLVAEEFPECKNYLDVYETAGLLSDKTVLAHGIFLKPEELEVIKQRGVTVVHCPNSNTMLESGVCPVRKMLDLGLKVSLGTDCAGGYSPSVLDSMRHALQTSIQASLNGLGKKLSLSEVFYMATVAGAKSLGLGDIIGNFVNGKDFDAVVVTLGNDAVDLLENYTLEQLFQKWIYLGDDRTITKVYVSGKLVKNN